jgi:hypothetical protein
VNQANASLDIDGIAPQPPSVPVQKCSNTLGFLNITSPLSAPWELALGLAPPVPIGSGGFALVDGQVVNMNTSDPTLAFLNSFFQGPPFPGGTLSIPFSVPAPFAISLQYVIFDGTAAAGVRLSQAIRFEATPLGGSQTYTLTDDSTALVSFAAAPLCGPASFSFYGLPYSSLYLSSNGNLCFGSPNQTYGPATAAAFVAGPPRAAGLWTDLDPSVGGTISVSCTATTVVADYNGVAQFSFPIASVNRTFRITLDATSNTVTYDNYNLVGASPGSVCGIGITPGAAAAATDPGQVNFLSEQGLGIVPGWPLPTDATYQHSIGGLINIGTITSIMFIPNASGNYDRVTL